MQPRESREAMSGGDAEESLVEASPMCLFVRDSGSVPLVSARQGRHPVQLYVRNTVSVGVSG